jgi:hypothetical protein
MTPRRGLQIGGLPRVLRGATRAAGTLLAMSSAVLHGVTARSSDHPLHAGIMVAMIGACFFCAYELWRWDTIRAWMTAGLMNLMMVAAHLPMAGGSHHVEATSFTDHPDSGAAMTAAIVFAAVEVALAAVVLACRTRRYQYQLVQNAIDGK